MMRFAGTAAQILLYAVPVFGMRCAVSTAGDLSKYRNFQLGSDLPTIAKQAAVKQSEAR